MFITTYRLLLFTLLIVATIPQSSFSDSMSDTIWKQKQEIKAQCKQEAPNDYCQKCAIPFARFIENKSEYIHNLKTEINRLESNKETLTTYRSLMNQDFDKKINNEIINVKGCIASTNTQQCSCDNINEIRTIWDKESTKLTQCIKSLKQNTSNSCKQYLNSASSPTKEDQTLKNNNSTVHDNAKPEDPIGTKDSSHRIEQKDATNQNTVPKEVADKNEADHANTELSNHDNKKAETIENNKPPEKVTDNPVLTGEPNTTPKPGNDLKLIEQPENSSLNNAKQACKLGDLLNKPNEIEKLLSQQYVYIPAGNYTEKVKQLSQIDNKIYIQAFMKATNTNDINLTEGFFIQVNETRIADFKHFKNQFSDLISQSYCQVENDLPWLSNENPDSYPASCLPATETEAYITWLNKQLPEQSTLTFSLPNIKQWLATVIHYGESQATIAKQTPKPIALSNTVENLMGNLSELSRSKDTKTQEYYFLGQSYFARKRYNNTDNNFPLDKTLGQELRPWHGFRLVVNSPKANNYCKK